MIRFINKLFFCSLVTLLSLNLNAQSSQIAIPRVEQMPNEPSPYNMRNWQEVGVKYDTFVYSLNKTGPYLPFVYLKNNGFNYPQNKSFGLVTYVGTNTPQGNEAINVLPSLVGASLVGIDKTTQNGQNWILMSQDFFNKNNGELIYLNNPNTSSGNDWWYDVMPNVFFYQINDLYPNIGDANFQFTSVANRFLESVRKMGGSDTPWSKASMNYRAWNFRGMKPNASGVKEPEAAGGYAWILYNAYKKTGNPDYWKGAEWSMEFLNEWNDNPSYELQLPYGTYVAAKMNAEIGTNYDIEKLVNWSFNRGALRGWGTIVGKWGGLDVSGLVGEANDNGNDYAFQLNGVQQAAALAPMVRYDKRFARAIGKWILNLANATRLFYPGFLPTSQQDASAWSEVNDPEKVIGYEALREKLNGKSPVSTGDALGGGWAATNLALYGTSSIGYLGGILQPTNVEKILQIDLLKTDFYNDAAYPTYLYYNPFSTAKTVKIQVGSQAVDIYESLSETFITTGATNIINVTIPANQAIVIVLTPSGGIISYDQNKMLVNRIVVDYKQTKQSFTYKPRIQALAALTTEVELNDSISIFAKAFDKDSENLTYNWSVTGGTIAGTGATIGWKAPDTIGSYILTLIVSDATNNRDAATLQLKVVPEINRAPKILEIRKSRAYVAPSGNVEFFANANDPNGDALIYTWSATGGSISGTGNTVNWTAPANEGIFQIKVVVTDDKGLSAEATTSILVKVYPEIPMPISLIAHYPFSGNANDVSGNQLHGSASGARLTNDFIGKPTSAYFFDGINDNISVPSNPLLNFQDAITVSCWIKVQQLLDREQFVVSHGSWQNRWKISITPERKIRWTVNSLTTIRDLDSELAIAKDSSYYVTATYDGRIMMLYVNGELQSYKEMTGKIRTTNLNLLIGQILPTDQAYNFSGTIDEVKIYDNTLPPESVKNLYQNLITAIKDIHKEKITLQVSPNPVTDQLTIHLPVISDANAILTIYNIEGKLIKTEKINTLSTIQLNVQDLQGGMYTIIIRSEKVFGVTKFVKR